MKDFEETTLNKEEASAMISRLEADDIGFEIVSANANAEMSIPVSRKEGKKGSILNVSISPDGPGLSLTCKGEFSITLRRGADSMLKDLGNALDLRLRGVIGKGGLYARGGFTAPVAGGDFEQKTVNWKESFPKITDYTIK